MFDAIFDAVAAVTGVGAVGFFVSLGVALLKQVGIVKKMHIEDLLDQAAARVVAYVQDSARETGVSGAQQREQAIAELVRKTGIDIAEAEERVRAAYQKMKNK